MQVGRHERQALMRGMALFESCKQTKYIDQDFEALCGHFPLKISKSTRQRERKYKSCKNSEEERKKVQGGFKVQALISSAFLLFSWSIKVSVANPKP